MSQMRPIAVDSKGSGLYQLGPGVRAFIDFEHPEDRMIRDLAEMEDQYDRWVAEEALERSREAERESWQQEDDEWPWREREQPSGSLEDVTYEDALRW